MFKLITRKYERAAHQKIYVALAAFLLLVCFLLNYFAMIDRNLQNHAYLVLERAGQFRVDAIETLFEEQFVALEAMAKEIAPQVDESDEHIRVLIETAVDYSAFSLLAVIWPDGSGFTHTAQRLRMAEKMYFWRALVEPRVLTYLPTALDARGSGVLCLVPIKRDDKVVAVLVGGLSAQRMSTLFNSEHYGDRQYDLLYDADGNRLTISGREVPVLGDQNLFEVYKKADLEDISLQVLRDHLKKGESDVLAIMSHGNEYYISHTPLSYNGWFLLNMVSAQDVADEYAFIPSSTGLLVAAVIIILLMLLAYMMWEDRKAKRLLETEKEAIKNSEERYRILEELTDNALFEVNLCTGTLFFNQNFSNIMLRPLEMVHVDDLEHMLRSIHPDDHDLFRRMVQNIRSCCARGQEEMRILDANGSPFWARIDFISQRDTDGLPTRVLGKISNIDREKREMQRLAGRAAQDSLTGLYNNATIKALINEFLCGEGAQGTHALLMIDLDNFKQVNDNYGHMMGDQVLVGVADEIKRLFRTSDILGRPGGDEFMVFLKDISSVDAIRFKAEDLCRAVRQLSVKMCIGDTTGCSVGIYINPKPCLSFDYAYARADAALYRAKSLGKNRYALYTENEKK